MLTKEGQVTPPTGHHHGNGACQGFQTRRSHDIQVASSVTAFTASPWDRTTHRDDSPANGTFATVSELTDDS
jgi:hypothetical protein